MTLDANSAQGRVRFDIWKKTGAARCNNNLLAREVAELQQKLEVGVTWPSRPTLNHREGHILDCGNDYIDLHQWFEI